MKKAIFAACLAGVCLLVAPALFAEAGDAKKPEPPTVPFVEKSETIGVGRVIIKIPYGTKVAKVDGGAYSEDIEWTVSTVKNMEQFKTVAEASLADHGYTIIEEDLFQTSTSAKARFQVGGIVTNFFATYKYAGGGCMGPGGGSGACKINLDAEFQLYDSVKDKVVFKAATAGYYENRKDIDSIEKLIVFAYQDAFLRFMAEPDFSANVAGQKTQSRDTPTNDEAPLRIGYAENGAATAMPGNISKLFGAVVTIKAGVTHGSGVVISDDGYILTAAHVVSGLKTVGVELEKGEKLEAQVVRVNRVNDSAVIKIGARKMRALSVNFTDPPIGSEVYIIGTPIERTLSYTVTKGIVSGYREKDGVKYIQTDSAVNPGNSGGPMLDGNGYVVGIVSSKLVGAGVESIGFAIPVRTVLQSLGAAR